MKRLQDKVAVITGAGSGIGKETALLFLEHGAKVVLADINKETLEETFEIIKQKKQESNACISITDVSLENDIKSMVNLAVDHFGGLDILFNNAGIGGAVGPITHINGDEWDKSFQILAKEINKNLNKNEKESIEKWKNIRNVSVSELKETLSILNHDFDLWLGESDVNNIIKPMIEKLTKEKKITLDDGALVSTQEKDPKILITKSDGSYLYLTTDLGTVLNRLENYPHDIVSVSYTHLTLPTIYSV